MRLILKFFGRIVKMPIISIFCRVIGKIRKKMSFYRFACSNRKNGDIVIFYILANTQQKIEIIDNFKFPDKAL
jgi:hypothetical protein